MEGKPYAANVGRVYEDFEPSEEWAREEAHDTLMVYMPGFRKENLRIQVTTSRNIRVLGERPLGHDNKWQRFRKEFPIPSNCDTNDISAKFESGVLYVKLPKMIAPIVEIKDKLHKPPTETPKPPAEALKAPEEARKPPTEAPKPQKPISTSEPAQPQKTKKINGPSEAVNGNGNYVPPRTMEKDPISTQSSQVNSSTNHVETEGKNFAHKALDKVKIATKSTEKLVEDRAKRAEESTKEEYNRAIIGGKNINAGGGGGGRDQCSRRPQGGFYKYKQVFGGFVTEMKQQPRKMVNLGLAVCFVLVLGLYAKHAINSIQGFRREEL